MLGIQLEMRTTVMIYYKLTCPLLKWIWCRDFAGINLQLGVNFYQNYPLNPPKGRKYLVAKEYGTPFYSSVYGKLPARGLPLASCPPLSELDINKYSSSLFQLVYPNLNELNNVSCCCEIEIIHLVSANFTPMRKKSLGPWKEKGPTHNSPKDMSCTRGEWKRGRKAAKCILTPGQNLMQSRDRA